MLHYSRVKSLQTKGKQYLNMYKNINSGGVAIFISKENHQVLNYKVLKLKFC